MRKYSQLRIDGPISAEVVENGTKLSGTFILLFGSTGVGKSNFMECLAGHRDMNISGDSLESVTQEITTYKLTNVIHEELITDNIYLIDCPGTSDNELSELAIVKALQTWVSDRATSPQVVLYFHRITDKRLPGSQRRTINLLKSLVGDPGKFSAWIGVVTTMWDMLLDHQVSGAEEKLVQLRRDHIGVSLALEHFHGCVLCSYY
ncbi:hypothetical protein BJ165DRAFT_1518724 [Panaeolus papilionaceus]|nr:hypothetical protein BJ165DRAFT_1518724 [Panaeolus papilionaceus]